MNSAIHTRRYAYFIATPISEKNSQFAGYPVLISVQLDIWPDTNFDIRTDVGYIK